MRLHTESMGVLQLKKVKKCSRVLLQCLQRAGREGCTAMLTIMLTTFINEKFHASAGCVNNLTRVIL